jgi:hypothetical protein
LFAFRLKEIAEALKLKKRKEIKIRIEPRKAVIET